MSIKSILSIFGGAPHELSALNAALSLAQSNAAQIRVLHISPDPGAYVAAYGGEVSAVPKLLNMPMSVMDAIYHRRSARDFTAENVSQASIHMLTYAAVQAPTAMHEEP